MGIYLLVVTKKNEKSLADQLSSNIVRTHQMHRGAFKMGDWIWSLTRSHEAVHETIT